MAFCDRRPDALKAFIATCEYDRPKGRVCDMIKQIKVPAGDRVLLLASDIVYAQRREWCGATYRQLSLSLIRNRHYYSYDPQDKPSLIIWICGGAFSEQNRNVWVPEMTYYAKRGYSVALID